MKQHYLPTIIRVLMLIGALAQPAMVSAHAGPPYVVLPERDLGPYRVIVWADPDVGGGLFLIDLSQNRSAVPADIGIIVSARPPDGRTLEISETAIREDAADGTRFTARLPFDTAGTWQVQLRITGADQPVDVQFPIEVTPPNPSWIESALCLIPFLLIGLAWLWAARRQAQQSAARAS